MSNDLKKLIAAKFFSELYFAVPIQTIFFLRIGLSLTQILWLESMLIAGRLLFEVPTGILGDKIGRKWTLVLSSVIHLLAWIPWFFAHSFPLFAVSFFLTGIASALYSGADQALIYDELKFKKEEKLMQKVFGIYNASYIFATGLAGLIGGLLATQQTLSQFYFLYQLMVVSQIIGLIILLTLKEQREVNERFVRSNAYLFLKDGLFQLWNNKKLFRIFMLFMLSTPFSIFLLRIYQPYFEKSHIPIVWFGYAIFISSMLTVGVKLLAYKLELWFGVKTSMLIATLLPAVMWLSMAILFNPIAAVILFILSDAAGNIRDPIFADYLNRHIRSENRATVLSIISLLVSIYTFFMQPLLGFLADKNLSYSFIAAFGIIFIGSLIFRLNERHVS